MPKPSGKRSAALQREASKRGEPVPKTGLNEDPTMSTDPTYHPEPEEGSDEDSHAEPAMPSGTGQVTCVETLSEKRKRRHENADLIPDRASKISRTSAWRNTTGKTKKSRAQNMQKSVASLFKKAIPSFFSRTKTPVPEEEEEYDSDIEIIEVDPSISAPRSTDTAWEHVADASDTLAFEASFMCAEGTNSSLNDSTAAAPYNAEAGTQESTLSPPIVVRDSGDFATHGIPPESHGSTPRSCNTTNVPEPPASPPILPATVTENEVPATDGSPSTEGTNSSDPKLDFKTLHRDLKRAIKQHRKKLTTDLKRPSSSNTATANSIIDLAALNQYNDLRYKLSCEREDLKNRLPSTPRNVRHRVKLRIARMNPTSDASNQVAGRCGRGPYYSRTLRAMANHLLQTGELPENRQGKGAHHATHLTNPDVASALKEWVKGALPVDEGGWSGNMRPAKLKRYVNDFLFPLLKIEDTISESTAIRWLKKLGFTLSRVRKGIYVDGHEREDVAKSREELINYLNTHVLPYCYTYEGADLEEKAPKIFDGTKIHYPIFHDETCFHANDLSNYIWMREGEQPLRNKSRGRIVHVSDFIIEHCGRLCLNPEEIIAQLKLPIRPSPPTMTRTGDPLLQSEEQVESPSGITQNGKTSSTSTSKTSKKNASKKKAPKTVSTAGRTLAEQTSEWVPPPPPAPFTSYRVSSFDARRVIYPGANYDPWWDMPQLIDQTKAAIEIFEAKYPNGITVFIFDCSSAHEAYASDALMAHKMNRGPGGKQPVFHDTYIPSTGAPQSMVFPPDYQGVDKDGESLAGKPKGMEQVLRERGLLASLEKKHSSKLVGVCAKCKMSQAARDAALKEAKSKRDEIEGSGDAGLSTRGVSDLEVEDLERPKDCCMQRVLSLEKDFHEEKPLLQLVIERAGHKCLFLPKFHCELNPIEMVWGQAKREFREKADGTFPTAKRLVPECLDSVRISNIRRYFRYCLRYMDAYRIGLSIKQAAYAVKKYTSHRRIPLSAKMDVRILSLK